MATMMEVGGKLALAFERERGGQRIVNARVTRLDDYGNAYVDLGEGEETFAGFGAAAKAGQAVQVLLGDDGSATIMTNMSDPADNGIARDALDESARARSAANAAEGYAKDAQKSAGDAAKLLEGVEEVAEQADKSVAQILADAAVAGTSARDAKESADSALASAKAAAYGLSDVEKVVGTVNWIAEHGRYVSEASGELVEGRVYYTRSGVGTADDPYVYKPVAEPDADEASSYYYLVVDESVQNYVASHLWINGDGLNLAVDETELRAVIGELYVPTADAEVADGKRYYARSGGVIQEWAYEEVASPAAAGLPSYFEKRPMGYYVVEPGGSVVAEFGPEGVVIGEPGKSQIRLDYHSLRLVDKAGSAYFHVSDLRGSDGYAPVVEAFDTSAYSEGAVYWKLNFEPLDWDTTTYSVDGVDMGRVYGVYGKGATVSPAVGQGHRLEISYQTSDENAKALTFGRRAAGSVGALSVSFGFYCRASGNYSSASGYRTRATGPYSHAEGYWTEASGLGSHAEGAAGAGSWNVASGEASHAEGGATTASGGCSHAEGSETVAGEWDAHAEGYCTTASGEASHAEGARSVASAPQSHAQNEITVAAKQAQTALGTCNVEDDATTTTHPSGDAEYGEYAVIVGNGTGGTAAERSNALAVRWDGLADVGAETNADSASSSRFGMPDNTTFPLFIWDGNHTVPTSCTGPYPVLPCFVYYLPDGGLYYVPDDGMNTTS